MNKIKNTFNLNCRSVKHQIGVTLFETMLSLAIFSVSLIGLYQLFDHYSRSTTQSLAAQQHQTFANAVQGHIKDNYQEIAAGLNTVDLYKISAEELIALNRLPAGFTAVNAFEQSMCAIVRMTPGLTAESLPQLQALVVAEGGKSLDDITLSRVSSQIGGSGGAVYAKDNQTILGTHGSWSVPLGLFSHLENQSGTNCNSLPGEVIVASGRPVSALWFENGDVSTSFLSRDEIPGLPTLNTMNTPLLMGEGTVTADGVVCSASQKGAIARDDLGRMLTCQSPEFKWRYPSSSFWADPVEQASWLSGFNSVLGQVRLDLETGQANYFSGAPGSGWSNLFVSPSGNLAVGSKGIHATGEDNAYFGIESVPPNATGAGNLHVGNRAGRLSSAGWGNTLLGNNVSSSSLGSTTNTMVGYHAGNLNRLTTGNAFVGAYAGAMNQTGNYNTFFGTRSGSQTLSSNNNFYGFSSGIANTHGHGNVGIGDWSGRLNALGNNNLFLGQYSGADSNVSNSIAIGNQATVSANNTIQIGQNNLGFQIQLGGPGSVVTTSSLNATSVIGEAFTGGTFTGVSFTTTSDARLKNNVADSERGLAFINQLRPVEYNLSSNGNQLHQGFIAQEVEAIDPAFTAVHKPQGVHGDFYSLNYIEFLPSIVKSIQELDARLEKNEKILSGEAWISLNPSSIYTQLIFLALLIASGTLLASMLRMKKRIQHLQNKISAMHDTQAWILTQMKEGHT